LTVEEHREEGHGFKECQQGMVSYSTSRSEEGMKHPRDQN